MAETYEAVIKERDILRARLAEVEKERDGLADLLRPMLYGADWYESTARPLVGELAGWADRTREALAKLEEK